MAVLIVIVILVALIVAHEFGHFITAKFFKVTVEEFGVGYPPRAFSLGKWRGTEYTLNWLPFGGFVRLLEEDPPRSEETRLKVGGFAAAPKGHQAIILAAGVLANVLVGWLLFVGAFMSGTTTVVPEGTEGARLMISSVVSDSPAAQSGLRAGDTIVYLADPKTKEEITVLTPESVVSFIETHPGKPIELAYVRGTQSSTVALVPAHAVLAQEAGRPAIGVALALVAEQKLTFAEALSASFGHTWSALKTVAVSLGALVRDAVFGKPDITALVGPVGLVDVVGGAAGYGAGYLLSLAAFISLNLAIVNLIPIPALDGGRLLFVGIEAVIQRRIPAIVSRVFNTFGFALIIFLMVAVTYNDIVRLLV